MVPPLSEIRGLNACGHNSAIGPTTRPFYPISSHGAKACREAGNCQIGYEPGSGPKGAEPSSPGPGQIRVAGKVQTATKPQGSTGSGSRNYGMWPPVLGPLGHYGGNRPFGKFQARSIGPTVNVQRRCRPLASLWQCTCRSTGWRPRVHSAGPQFAVLAFRYQAPCPAPLPGTVTRAAARLPG